MGYVLRVLLADEEFVHLLQNHRTCITLNLEQPHHHDQMVDVPNHETGKSFQAKLWMATILEKLVDSFR